MASPKEALRRQRRRELDARRGKSRIRLGSCLESWDKLRETLGLSLHSELAQYLLDSYFSKVCSRCSGYGIAGPQTVLSTTPASLQQLVLLVHNHSQHCLLPPSLQIQRDPETSIQENPKVSIQGDTYTQPGSKGVTQASPKAPKAKYRSSLNCAPQSLMNGEPNSTLQANPAGCTEANLEGCQQSGFKSSLHSDPKVSILPENVGSIQADPKPGIQVGPKGFLKTDPKGFIQAGPKSSIQADSKRFKQTNPNKCVPPEASLQAQMCLKYTCEAGHVFTWCLMQSVLEVEDTDKGEDVEEQEEAAPPTEKSTRKRGRMGVKENMIGCADQEVATSMSTRSSKGAKSDKDKKTHESREKEGLGSDVPDCSGEYEEPDAEEVEEPMCSQEDDAVTADVSSSTLPGNNDMNSENIGNESQRPADRHKTQNTVPRPTKRGSQKRVDPPETKKADNMRLMRRKRNNGHQSVKNEELLVCGKRKRKATPKLILPCEFSGCWKIFSSRQYLNHHMKYQHVQQKTFICSHPSCGKSFNFKKHLKEHEKLHSDQRDYICEFCARAFRTSSNLSIHRRIHTGEKPLQCEVCGYTCRQKASLNWHMRKHNAESSYQFPCEICGRRFEKRDNVMAHRSKSHPEHLTNRADMPSQELT